MRHRLVLSTSFGLAVVAALSAPMSAARPDARIPAEPELRAGAPDSSAEPADRFPGSLSYRGLAFDAAGAPLAGRFAVELSYFDARRDRKAELLRERHEAVEVAAGRFALELGRGTVAQGAAPAAVASLRALFAAHPEVEMELTIGGVRQAPRVRLLPAGHSLESRLVLAGMAKPNDGRPHSEGYGYRPTRSAVQAVALRPAPRDAGPAAGRESTPAGEGVGPFEIEMTGPWRSRPLRELRASPGPIRTDAVESEEINPIRHEDLFDASGVRYGTGTGKIADPLAALSRTRSAVRTPELVRQFEGVGNLSGLLPPDPNGAVGPHHYVQVVNTNFQVFNKDGTSAGGPYPTNSLWSGYGGPCESFNDGDAVFLFDRYGARWILAQFAVSNGEQSICFAISQSDDPLGEYALYEVVTQRFPDYFKLGVWPDPSNNAILMSTNSGFQGAYDVYALDRASMLAGVAARPAIFFQSFKNLLMPADANGPLLPPGGSAGLLYTFRDGGEPYFSSPAADSLDLYAFHVDWTTPASSTMTLATTFTPSSGGLANFNWTICGFFEQDCLPQPDTAVGLDSGSWWPMFRFQYRRFADHEALVGSWTVDVTGTPDHAAPRWFELRRTGGAWSIHQQGTQAPDAAHRWEPSIAMDRDGNIALGYSVVDAGSSLYASIRYATRAAGDPPGTLQPEQTLFAGGGAQTHAASRWGDYSSLTVDPVNDCTFWYTNEYLATTGSAPWHTRIGAFTYPGCGGLEVSPLRREVCAAKTGAVDFDITLSGRFDSTTDLAVFGCPAGASCQFTTDPVVSPATDSQLQVSNLGAAASGIYELLVQAIEVPNPADSYSNSVELALWSAAPAVAALDAPANAATGQPLRPAFSWSAAADAESYTLEVATDPGFQQIVYTTTVGGTSAAPGVDLPSNTTLYWRVRTANFCDSVTSATRWFDTVALAGDCPAGKIAATFYSEEFESGAAGWSSSGTGNSWAASTARQHSGATSWHAVDPDSVTDQRLVSPAVALPAGESPVTLGYWSWRSIEQPGTCYDGALLELSTDDGGSWSQAVAELINDPYDGAIVSGFANPLAGLDGWCGERAWTSSSVLLDAFAGQSVRLRFRLGSDNYVGTPLEGWYLDDVELRSCVPNPSIFSDGFEIANPTRWSTTAP